MANLLPVTGSKRTWTLLWCAMWRTPWQLALLVLLFVASSITALFVPVLVGRIIDRATAGELSAYPVADLVLLALAVILGALLTRAWTFQGQRLGVRLNRDLGIDLVEAALKLDAQTVEDAGSGDLVARLTDDLDSVRQVLATGLPEFSYIGVYMVLTSVTIFTVNPVIGLVTVPMFVLMTLALVFFLPRIARLTRERTEAVSELTVVSTENIRGAVTVRELGIRRARQQALEDRIEQVFYLSDKMVVFRSVFWAIDAFNSFLPLVLSVVWGAYCVQQGWASWGQVATASIMLFTMRINSDIFTYWLDKLREMTVTMGRVFGVIDLSGQQQRRREERAEETEARQAGLSAEQPVVEVISVSYGYDPHRPVIKDVNLHLDPGQSLALVGRSGSGKTTLARLIAGSLTADAGSVRVCGLLVGNGLYPTGEGADGRPALLVCTQEAHLFVGTLRDNLLVAAPRARDEELLAALESVGADWVDDLPEGLDTEVSGEGQELARDQVQQLALARIVAANPLAVILDESTTQLDLADARQSLAAVLGGRAVIIISHDARIAALADRAVLLEEGQLVAEGSPADIFDRA